MGEGVLVRPKWFLVSYTGYGNYKHWLYGKGDVSLTNRHFEQTLKNVIPLSQQCYLRFLRVLRLRLSAAHSSPHLFLVHICSIGNMSGDKLYIKLAVLHTGLPIVLSMFLLALMVLQLTKIFVYIPLGSKGSIQHKLSLWYCHTRLWIHPFKSVLLKVST